MQRVRFFFDNFLDFLFPATCIVCRQGEKLICDKCFENIPLTLKDNLNTLSVFQYKDKVVNTLLWRLKYHHSGDVAKIFASKMAEELRNWLKDFPENLEIIFIPTPLNIHDKRLNNHAELLAKEISKYFPNSKVFENLLVKNSQKKQAHTKSKHERIKNVERKFEITSVAQLKRDELVQSLSNKLVIIVDDVTTTGATITNIRYVLSEFLEIEPDRILGLTIAH